MPPLDAAHDITLEDERARLRPLTLADVPALLPFAAADPDLWRYSLQQPSSPAAMETYVKTALAARDAGTAYPSLVVDGATGEVAGSTRYYGIDPHHRTCLIGFTWYGARFRGSRLNAHCKRLLLDFASGQMDVARGEFRADARNARSLRAVEKLGAVREGTLRSNCAAPGGRRNCAVLSILRDEYLSGPSSTR